ncbi:coiled-coil domain-containing protein [Wolbachia pipientis]|uniref:hypothetical protein n=1 Tax=Wolbachia pipientis TaxID=955 RepID=UPI0015FA5B86|nr:hypothetical protein [Wolbachia pipientis]
MCSLSLRPGNSPLSYDNVVGRLQHFGLPTCCYPSYGTPTFIPVGLTPTEHTHLLWTHASKRLQRSKQQLKEKDEEIIALKAQQNIQEVANLQQQLKAKDDEIKDLQEQLNNQPNATLLKAKDDEIKDLQEQLNNQPNATLLKAKDDEIKDLQEQLNNRPSAAQLQAKDEEITQLKAQVQQLQAKNAEVVELNKQLEESKSLVDKLQKKKQTLEDKSKTTEQPKQGNGAKYTATVGVGLAAGLIAFTALEHTVRLEMLVIIGIAVTSALVAGGITYAVLPSTQVDGAKEQEVNEMGKRSNKG